MPMPMMIAVRMVVAVMRMVVGMIMAVVMAVAVRLARHNALLPEACERAKPRRARPYALQRSALATSLWSFE